MARIFVLVLFLVGFLPGAWSQPVAEVIDIPTRPGVTQRFLYATPAAPQATVVLIAGGHGGLQLSPSGGIRWGADNFVVRTRDLYVQQGLAFAVVDAPSDRQSKPFLSGYRQTAEHVADIKAVIAWLRAKNSGPVWLVGTSMGTLSTAFVATQLSTKEGGPDGVVLTSSILEGSMGLRPVQSMPLEQITARVLVVHHEEDGCKYCPFSATGSLMGKLVATPRKALLSFKGGEDRGDPCYEWAHHGFNGQEKEVVQAIADWIKAR
jgi:dienelactone hydrolase